MQRLLSILAHIMEFKDATIYATEDAVERMKQLPYEIVTLYGKAELHMIPADLEGYENFIADIAPRFMMANEIWAQQNSKIGKVKLAYMCLTDDEGVYIEFVK